jgi:membrane-bound lytic murein transglycosylase D
MGASKMWSGQVLLLAVLLVVFNLSNPTSAVAQQVSFTSAKKTARGSDFVVPAKLRPRVDFWIDIFTRYGKAQSVVHHRDYPQAIFRVLDFSSKFATLSERQFKKFKDKEIKKHISEVRAAMKHLATGKAARNALEKRIVTEMSFLPTGSAKYKKVVDDGLIRAQTGIKERYAEAVQRSGRYLHIIEKIFVQDYGLPVELTRLPFVESSFDYTAYSSAGAAGIWQFMRATARNYMKVNSRIDERRDVISATHGAAQYLQFAYTKLGKWPLALTSYNHGITGVSRKVKKAGTRDIIELIENPSKQHFGFASQNFWPEFLAALEVYDNLPKYFPNLQVHPPQRIAFLKLPHDISVKTVMTELAVDLQTLKSLNYAISSRVWSGAYDIPKGYALKVPAGKGPALNKLRNPRLASKTFSSSASTIHGGIVYRVRSGDSLSRIARKYRTTVSNLRKLNGLKSDLVKVGQRLVVRQNVQRTTRPSTATSSATTYRVRRGDNLSSIASQFGTTVSTLKRLNGLKSSAIRSGQTLRVRGEAKPKPKNNIPKNTTQTTPKSAVPASPKYHVVRRGDTLYSLARKYNTSVTRIKALNKISSNSIHIGRKLIVRAGSEQTVAGTAKTYTVRSGDSLWTISRKLGKSIASIKQANGLKGSGIKIGQRLRVP